jgi:hypothetical protein
MTLQAPDLGGMLKRISKEIRYVFVCGVNSFYSREGPVAGHCEHCNDHPGSIKGEKIHFLKLRKICGINDIPNEFQVDYLYT